MKTDRAVRIWMLSNLWRFTDRRTDEIDATTMVETWDLECSDGGSTLDPNHPAWDEAAKIANYKEGGR